MADTVQMLRGDTIIDAYAGTGEALLLRLEESQLIVESANWWLSDEQHRVLAESLWDERTPKPDQQVLYQLIGDQVTDVQEGVGRIVVVFSQGWRLTCVAEKALGDEFAMLRPWRFGRIQRRGESLA